MDTSLKTRFDSVIFDLDGTLWDSTANVAHAWQEAVKQVDFPVEPLTQEKVMSITGLPYDVIFERLFPDLTTDQRQQIMTACAGEELRLLKINGGTLYEGLEQTLIYLKQKYRLFIVSNCQSGYIETFFHVSGLDHYFEGHQCFGTKGQPKAENIKDVVADFNLQSPVYIGDTWGDHDAAKKAEVPYIFASYGFGDVTGGNQVATINELTDLISIL